MKSKQKICFEFKDFVSVVSLPDFEGTVLNHSTKHCLFKIIFSSKNHVFACE